MSTAEQDLDVREPNSLGVRNPVPTRYLGRQPIVDEKSRLYGYELLFRAGTANCFSGDPELATQEVVDHWMMLMPEPEETFAFVNCTRETLVQGLVSILSPAHTILEILETVNPDSSLMSSIAALKKQGYRFALDDFFPDPARAAFLEIADFVKIDFRASSPAIRRDIYKMLDGSWALRIAEKIETEEEMRVARGEGCLLFQGYFFSRPVLVTTRSVPQNRLVYLRLLAALHDVPANLRTVESLVMSDASLCYRVLRLANSALQGHAGVITSVREALLLVGDDAVRRMVTVALAGV
jgi:EAL and modified HD-GYP domain-containing signal transduction protein